MNKVVNLKTIFKVSVPVLALFLAMAGSISLASSAPVITVTKTDALQVDVDLDGQADPGDTIRYTVEIQNTGNMNASNVLFDDTIDANTTLSGVAHVSPLAFKDSYTALGNVGLNVSAANGLLLNDADPDGTVATSVAAVQGNTANVGSVATTAQGGSVIVQANGAFVYTPAPGFEGDDTFTYTITDGDSLTPNDTDTVTITVSEVIWFIDSTAAAGGNGTLAAPFDSTADMGPAADEAGDIIFIDTNATYVGGLVLEDDQIVIGDGSTASIPAVAGITVPPFSNTLPIPTGTVAARPTITAPGGNAIQNLLGMESAILRGFDIGTAQTGINWNSSIPGTSLTISEMALDTGAGEAVSFVLVDLDVTLDSVSSSAGNNNGIRLQNTAGSFTVTGTGTPGSGGTISGKAGPDNNDNLGNGIFLFNTTTDVELNDMQLNDFQNYAIRGRVVAGSFTLADSVINTTSGFNGTNAGLDEGSIRFTNLTGTALISNSTIATGASRVVLIQNTNAANLNLTVTNTTISDSQSSPSGDSGLEVDFLGTSTGTVNVSGSSFLRNRTTAAQIFARDSAVVDVDLKTSIFDPGIGIGRGSEVAAEDNAQLTFEISNNPTVKARGGVAIAAVAINNATMQGRIENNSNIDMNGDVGAGIFVASRDSADTVVDVNGNTMTMGTEGSGGIQILANEPIVAGGTATLNATINNNTVNLGSATFGRGIFLQDHSGNLLCANINNNSVVDGAGTPEVGLSVVDQSGTPIQIQGLAGPVAGGGGTAGALDTPWTTKGNSSTADAGNTFLQGNAAPGTCLTPTLVSAPTVAPAIVEKPDGELLALSSASLEESVIAAESNNSDKILTRRPQGLASFAFSGETINQSIGTMEPGQSVTIVWDVVVDAAAPSQVCNQATVTAVGGISVLSDDPDVGGAADSTCTAVEVAPVCPTFPISVGTEAELNTAIGCYNAAPAGDYEINVMADILLTANTTPINNSLATTLVINGNNHTIDGDNQARIFNMQDSDITISGLTMQQGAADASVSCIGAGFAPCGGAIFIESSAVVTLTQTSVLDSSADYGGGAHIHGKATIIDSTFSGNRGALGAGGIWNRLGDVTIVDSTFSDNSSLASSGGGVSNGTTGTPIAATLTISNSTFSGNSADDFGGGVANGTIATISNSTFSGNTAGIVGGGVFNSDTATIRNSTLSNNSANGGGGGVYGSGSTSTMLNNSIVANNITGGNCSGLITADAFNIDSDGTCDNATTHTLVQINLGPLQNNGGQTDTMALGTGSVAVDAAAADPAITTDQRGVARPQGSAPDVGAFETIYCSAGEYLANPGDTTCTPAAAGNFVPADGATSQTECPVGFYQDQTGQTGCIPAPIGSYVDVTEASTFTNCPAGETTAGEGSTDVSACFPIPGTIIIINDSVPDDEHDFSFTTTGGLSPSSFNLDDDADGTLPNTQTYNDVPPGAYTVSEASHPDYYTSLNCVDPDGGTTTLGATATIDLDVDETVTCTFTNALVTSSTVVVKPSSLNGWGALVETPNGSLNFVAGPNTPPLSDGSAEFMLNDMTGGVILGTQAYTGARLDQIVYLEYSTYNTVGNNLVAPALQINIDYDLTDSTTSWQGRLVFEPYQDPGNTIVDGTWQMWDPLAGNWWSSGTPVVGDNPVAQACPQSSPCDWSTILATYPDAGVQTGSLSGVLFKAGSSWPAGYKGSVDKFVIQVANEITTYDFEPDKGSITVIKSATPTDGTDFPFTFARPGLPDLSAILDDDADPTRANNFTVNGLNAGDFDITETLPAGWQLDSVDCGAGVTTTDITDGVTVSLAQGQDVTCTFNNRLEVVDLELSKSDSGITAEPGDTVVYTIIYENKLGFDTATNVVLTETVPPNTTFNATASTGVWSCADGSPAGTICTQAVGNLLSNSTSSSTTFAVDVDNPFSATGGVQILNTATISSDQSDADPSNNTVFEATPITAAPELAITKSDGGGTFAGGDTIVYSIDVSNTGNRIAPSVIISETVPTHTSFNQGASSAGWTCSPMGGPAGANCTLQIPLLDNTPQTILFAVNLVNPLPIGVTSTDNHVDIRSSSQFPEANTDNNEFQLTTQLDNTSSITIIKDVTYVADIDIDSDRDFAFFSAELGNFFLDDPLIDDTDGITEEIVFLDQVAGNYTITEGPNGNWIQSVVCVGDDNITYLGPDIGATIDLDAGENVVCTFTNERVTYELTYTKVLSTGSPVPPTDWEFTLASLLNLVPGDIDIDFGVVTTATAAGGSSDTLTLPLDAYKVGEVVPGNYELVQIDCGPGGLSTAPPVNDQFTIILDQNLTCTFTNQTTKAEIMLTKNVIKDHGGTAGVNDFGLSINGTLVNSGQTILVTANQPVTIDEVGLDGYDFVSITGDAKCPAVLGGSMTPAPGEKISCTITNDDQPGTLTIIKDTVPDDPQDFSFSVTGGLIPANFLLDDDANATLNNTRTYSGISTGTYEITEAPVLGFDTFINCVDASGDTTVVGNKATAKVALGETVTCTFTNEKQIPEISIDDVSIVEGTGGTTTMQFTVVRTNNYFATSVTANSADNVSPTKADSPADYGPIINEVVNFAPGGSLSKVVSVDIVTDAIVETDETFFLNLSNPVNGTLVDAQGEGTIENDDKATLKLSGGTSRTETDSGQVEYTFYAVLYDAVQGGFTLDVASLDLTATVADGDYVANSDTLTFVGDVDERHPFKILVNGDTKVEPDETFAAQITNGPVTPLAADIMVTTEVGRFDLDFHTAKIFNDDSAKVTLTGAEVVTEGDSGNTFVKYTATLDNPVVGGFKIPFSTLSGSASNTSDFVDNDQTLTFNGTAGEEKSVTVRVLGDELVEADETFYVSLGDFMNTSLGGYLSVAGSPKVVTIENDDVATVTLSGDVSKLEGDSRTTTFTFEATLDADVDGGFDIAYSIDDGTATTVDGDYQDTAGTLRFSGNKGETQTITVLVNGDVVGEAHETFKVVLRGVTPDKSGITIDKAGSPFEATITNDDTAVFFIDVANIKVSEGSGSIPFEVTLSNRVATTTTVEYHTSDGSAVDGVDYTGVSGTLTFAPGEGVKVVDIPILDDTIDEADETIIVTLSNSTGAGFGNPHVVQLLISDDDPTPEVNIDGSPLKVSESVSSLTVVVSLSNPSSSTVEVDINSADGSATAGSDYTAVAQTLTFAPGETSKTITLPILSDAIYEGDETLTLSLSNPDNANLGVEATEVVTILEDSAVPGMSIASVSMLEPESGEAQMNFEVVLSKAAAVDIAVDFTTVDGTAVAGEDYVATSGQLVIKAGTTKGTISVTVLADSDQEGDETFSLILSNPAGAELDPTAATGVTGVIKTGGSVIFLPLISNR